MPFNTVNMSENGPPRGGYKQLNGSNGHSSIQIANSDADIEKYQQALKDAEAKELEDAIKNGALPKNQRKREQCGTGGGWTSLFNFGALGSMIQCVVAPRSKDKTPNGSMAGSKRASVNLTQIDSEYDYDLKPDSRRSSRDSNRDSWGSNRFSGNYPPTPEGMVWRSPGWGKGPPELVPEEEVCGKKKVEVPKLDLTKVHEDQKRKALAERQRAERDRQKGIKKKIR